MKTAAFSIVVGVPALVIACALYVGLNHVSEQINAALASVLISK